MPAVVADRHMPGRHAQPGRRGRDGPVDVQPGPPKAVMADDRICPQQPGRGTERLGHGFLGREAASQGADRPTYVRSQRTAGPPAAESWRAPVPAWRPRRCRRRCPRSCAKPAMRPACGERRHGERTFHRFGFHISGELGLTATRIDEETGRPAEVARARRQMTGERTRKLRTSPRLVPHATRLGAASHMPGAACNTPGRRCARSPRVAQVPDRVGKLRREALGLAGVLGLDHDADGGLGAARPHQHPARVAELCLGAPPLPRPAQETRRPVPCSRRER